MTLKMKLILTFVAASISSLIVSLWVSSSRISAQGDKNLIEKSQAILSRIEVGSQYVAQMETLDGIVEESLRLFPDGKLPEHQKLKILKSVPVFAAFQLGQINAEKEHYVFRVASNSPRNPKNQATSKEAEIIAKFNTDPNLQEWVEIDEQSNSVIVSRPVRINSSQGCLVCHGEPSQSPYKNGKDILGYQMEGMKDKDLRGIFQIVSSRESAQASAKEATLYLTGLIALVTALGMGFVMWVLARSINGIKNVSQSLKFAAMHILNMSQTFESSSAELSSQSLQQSSALEQTTSSMEQISAMVTRNADHARQSEMSTSESRQTAQDGQSAIQSVDDSISEIEGSNKVFAETIERSNEELRSILIIIEEITNKTKVINDIVFQTRLLSFNASVEAARAGEHGKGFAVVAEEIGTLAKMSGDSADEISKILAKSVEQVQQIIRNSQTQMGGIMQANKSKVEVSREKIQTARLIFQKIVDQVLKIEGLAKEISVSSGEQSRGVDEINKAMLALNEITHKNTELASQSSVGSKSLAEQVHQMEKMSEKLIQEIDGKAA